MMIDGKALAHAIQEELRADIEASGKRPTLAIFAALDRLPESKRLAIEKFIHKKKAFAEEIGVEVQEYNLPKTSDEAVQVIQACSTDGIIVQLPLPATLDTERLCNAIPHEKDVDLLSSSAKEHFAFGESPILPPVVGAIAEIIERNDVSLTGKHAVVVGKGSLVGVPVATWLLYQGVSVESPDKGADLKEYTEDADIVVLGAGSPGILTADMVKEGVLVFDAGTSEAAGMLKGDADPNVSEKAALFTPVPGGIGPITVAILFKNLCILSGLHSD